MSFRWCWVQYGLTAKRRPPGARSAQLSGTGVVFLPCPSASLWNRAYRRQNRILEDGDEAEDLWISAFTNVEAKRVQWLHLDRCRNCADSARRGWHDCCTVV